MDIIQNYKSSFPYTIQMNSGCSQDTGYSRSWSPSSSSLPSDIQDKLTMKSQRDLHITLEKRPQQLQCPLSSSTPSMVSITNNNYYMGPDPFLTAKPSRSFSCPPKPFEVINMVLCKNVHSTVCTGPLKFIAYTCIFTAMHMRIWISCMC